MFSYSVVEATLVRHFLPEGDILPFRARLRNLQRLGLVPSSPGKGNHQQYDFSDLCDYALALMLAEFGLEPRKIVTQIKRGIAAKVDKGTYCVYYPEYFTKGKSNLMFVPMKTVQQLSVELPRLAVINIGDMKWKLEADLQGILQEKSLGGEA